MLPSEFISKPTTEPFFEVTSKFNHHYLKPPYPHKKWVLAFYPNNTEVETIIKMASVSLGMSFSEGEKKKI